MKTIIKIISTVVLCVLFTDCATIAGGQKYFAHVRVDDHPNADIKYNGMVKGKGNATFKVDRKLANQLTFEVKEDGCETQKYSFHNRTFRGWTLAGTIITWTAYFIPVGVIVDGGTGAWWKPSIEDQYVSKLDYNNYNYALKYEGCEGVKSDQNDYYDGTDIDVTEEPEKKEGEKSKADRLREIKNLFDEGILTEEEYQKEKTKILEED